MRRVPHADLYSLADVYEAMFSWSPSEEVEYMLSLIECFLGVDEARQFLDIGCGTGRVAKGLRDLGFEVTCLDVSSEMCAYARKSRSLDALQGDMLNIPLRSGAVDVAYSLLATLNHVDSLRSLKRHLEEVHRALREGGLYVADLVVNTSNCLGVCDEWSVTYRGSKCRVLHIVEAIEDEYIVESLELICGDRVRYRSRSRLYLPKQKILEEAIREAGFKRVTFLKPFTLQQLSSPRGRVFAVIAR